MDQIVIRKLCVRSSLTSGPKPIYQPILISVFIPTDVTLTAISDDISYTINYAKLAASITEACDQQSFPTLLHLVKTVNKICPGPANKIIAEQPKGFFRASALGVELINVPGTGNVFDQQLTYFIQNLQLSTIIGVNPEERVEKQFVVLNLSFGQSNASLYEIAIHVSELVEASSYGTLEALTLNVVNDLQQIFKPLSTVTVGVTKPKAVTFSEGAGVEVTRSSNLMSTPKQVLGGGLGETLPFPNVAYVAFGSNIEPRIQFITQALQKINNSSQNMKILQTSFLYESLPMYYEDQSNFYNGVIKVNTNLTPMELLGTLQNIQEAIGRKKGFENGPREIDLDILFYDDVVLNTPQLKIPHPRIQEREFVLRPFLDLTEDFVHPVLKTNVLEMLNSLMAKESSSLQKVFPLHFKFSGSTTHWVWNSKTFVMGILNTSPDSFSAPGITNLELAANAALEMESEGVDMIDIGVQSRRPGATEALSTAEEIQGFVSLIRLIRERGCKVPISVDVFKSAVAEAAIEAGADVINDVGMGFRDPSMIPMAARLGVPIIFMHTRGTPVDMQKFTSYENDDVVSGVIKELYEVTERALAAGVFRWNIIIDPGIGFAKMGEQNMEILRNLDQFRKKESVLHGYPLLTACSKKKFIQNIVGVPEASQTRPGTMATTAACISLGADIVRVHDVSENVQVAKVADSFWRVKPGKV